MKTNSQPISGTNNQLEMYFALYLVSRNLWMRKAEIESAPFLVSLKINYKTILFTTILLVLWAGVCKIRN